MGFGLLVCRAVSPPNTPFLASALIQWQVSGPSPLEPLDTMIRFERADNNNGRAVTHEILSHPSNCRLAVSPRTPDPEAYPDH